MVGRCLSLLSWLILGIAGVAAPLAAATNDEMGLPFLRNFAPRDYNANGQNWAITQDRNGVMYIGNTDGVLVFDGLRWQLVKTTLGTVVRGLAVDGEGRVHVGALGEVGYLAPGADGSRQFVSELHLVPERSRAFDDVHNVFVRNDGVYYFTYARLFRLADGSFREWLPKRSFHRAFQVGERLFVRDRDLGLMELRGDALHVVPGGERFAHDRVDAMLPLYDGALLVGSRDGGLLRLDADGARPFATDIDAALKHDQVYSGSRLPDGRYAIGTFQAGVYIIDGQGRLLAHVDKAHGLLDDTVYASFVDREGGLWLGLDRGLARVETALPITRFEESTGLSGGVLALKRFDDTLYAGTNQGLFRLRHDGSRRFDPIPGIRGQTWAMAAVDHSLLVGHNDGTYDVRDGVARLIQQADTATTMDILPLASMPGHVLIGLWDGLSRLRRVGDQWLDDGRIPDINLSVSSMLETQDGRIWIGTWADGAARLQLDPNAPWTTPPKLERFGIDEGLPNANDVYVQRIGGKIRFATRKGIYRFDETTRRFQPDPDFAALFAQPRWIVHRVAEDSTGRVWMQTLDEATGVRESGVAIRDTQGRYQWEPRYTRSLLGSWNDVIAAEGNVLWFGGNDGLYRIRANDPPPASVPFVTLIHAIGGANGTRDWRTEADGTLAIPFQRHALRFDYAAPLFRFGPAPQFQVRLDGNDSQWSDWRDEPYREYTNLSEGRYQFRVRARTADGDIGDEAVVGVRILPPWYRTIWAYLGYLALLALAGSALLRWRLAHVRHENRLLEAIVASRTNELRDKNRQLEEARETAVAERQVADVNRVRAEEANRAKTVFLANMSHELRTPLNAVIGFAQLMDRQEPRSDDDRRHLATILRSGEHLLSLINDVLSLSRIEAGALSLDVAPFDLRALVENVCELVRVRADGKDLWLRTELDIPVAAVSGDARKLSQILLNLIGNAVKFTHHGGVQLRVRWRDGRAAFEIEDTGPGIAAHELSHLFEPFVQTETGRAAKEGTGLGLALSRDLARMMGGDIIVRSAPGVGSCFTVTAQLPVSHGALPIDPSRMGRVRGLAPGETQRRLLVVDDVSDNRVLLSGLLAAVGFDVRTAESGEEAISVWRSWQPHLIWLDKRMPGMDGTEAARRIRAEEAQSDRARTVIIALSASALEHERDEIIASGCDDFLAKPFRDSVIFAKLGEHLGVRFRYSDVTVAAKPEPVANGPVDVAQRLARCPEAHRQALRQALAVGDLDAARQMIADLAATDTELAAHLAALLAAYRLDDLEALLATPDA